MSSFTESADHPGAPFRKSMSAADLDRTAQVLRNRILFDSIAAFARQAGRVLAAAAQLLSGWWTRTQVHDELMGLDDRMLADIGISRADIPAVAAGRNLARPFNAPRLVAEQVNRTWRPEMPAAHNDQAAPRVA
jgi:uncharacterized protein YjiS (DUF1127 family)